MRVLILREFASYGLMYPLHPLHPLQDIYIKGYRVSVTRYIPVTPRYKSLLKHN